MARLKRIVPLGVPQHIIQRGNNRQACFACDQDMAFYASLLHEYSKKFSVLLHAWVFMTNHVHLLASPHKVDGISTESIGVKERCGKGALSQALCNLKRIYCSVRCI